MANISVVVTGVGPISAIGCGRNEFCNALLQGGHGFGPITLCATSASATKIGPAVKDFQLATFIQKHQVLLHSVGLGGFYCSTAAFEAPDIDPTDPVSGKLQVR